MPKAASTDARIDAYIAKSPAFAQPILTEVRSRVHAALPGAEETIKWNAPFFLHDGKLLVSMAAFKNHAKVLVWEGNRPSSVDVTTVAELPSAAAFAKQVKAAAAQIDGGGAAIASRTTPVKVPATKVAAGSKPLTSAAAKKPAAKKPAPKKPAAKVAAAKRAAPNGAAAKAPAAKRKKI